MASLTKKQRDRQEVIKRKIMDGNRRGVCDTYGRSILKNGKPVAKPRTLGPTARRYCNQCGEWYPVRESHECQVK